MNLEKNSIRAGMVLTLLAVAACGLVSFDVDQDLPEQKVQGSPLGGVLPNIIPSPIPISINLNSETDKRGTGPASHAYLKSLTLAVTPHAAPAGNFDFLDEVHIFVSSPNNSALPRVEVATLKPVPKGQTQLTFAIVPNVDLLPYINAGSQIDADAKGTAPQKDVSFDGHITVTVKI